MIVVEHRCREELTNRFVPSFFQIRRCAIAVVVEGAIMSGGETGSND
jgi:hypothetical protein